MIKNLFIRLVQNKHTSGAALVFGGCELASGMASIWMPQYQAQVDATVKLIQKVAIGYGLLFAGDAPKPPPAPESAAEQIAKDTYHAPTP